MKIIRSQVVWISLLLLFITAFSTELIASHLALPRPNRDVVISCFYDGNPPVCLKWAGILVDKFAYRHYKITLVLHGACLKYSLKSSKYPGGKNPFESLLKSLTDQGIRMVVCDLCLNDSGFS